MIRVHHKIMKKNGSSRVLDRYTIFNNCIFRKRIKYLFIGLNPSAPNDEFTDKVNLWIINWIIRNDKSGGYYLTNLYKNISTTSATSTKDKNDQLEVIIKKLKHKKICVFYGSGEAKRNIMLNDKTKEILNKALKEERLFMTCDCGQFHHISKASKKLKIEKCEKLSDIGI